MSMRMPLVILLAAMSWLLLAVPPTILVLGGMLQGDVAAALVRLCELTAKAVALMGVVHGLIALVHLVRCTLSKTRAEAKGRIYSAAVMLGYAITLTSTAMLLHAALSLTSFAV